MVESHIRGRITEQTYVLIESFPVSPWITLLSFAFNSLYIYVYIPLRFIKNSYLPAKQCRTATNIWASGFSTGFCIPISSFFKCCGVPRCRFSSRKKRDWSGRYRTSHCGRINSAQKAYSISQSAVRKRKPRRKNSLRDDENDRRTKQYAEKWKHEGHTSVTQSEEEEPKRRTKFRGGPLLCHCLERQLSVREFIDKQLIQGLLKYAAYNTNTYRLLLTLLLRKMTIKI